ncbi:hypothetical protein AB0B15_17180 [Streptomyces sp. NPDC045456]|uniref:hypothetical protein n=1 Tax=Streptomyces sp. NPDC045456 TaxID=3155254 RepID=UPI0033F61B7C
MSQDGIERGFVEYDELRQVKSWFSKIGSHAQDYVDDVMLTHVVEIYDASDEETITFFRIRCLPKDAEGRCQALASVLERVLHRDLATSIVYIQQ